MLPEVYIPWSHKTDQEISIKAATVAVLSLQGLIKETIHALVRDSPRNFHADFHLFFPVESFMNFFAVW